MRVDSHLGSAHNMGSRAASQGVAINDFSRTHGDKFVQNCVAISARTRDFDQLYKAPTG